MENLGQGLNMVTGSKTEAQCNTNKNFIKLRGHTHHGNKTPNSLFPANRKYCSLELGT